MLLVAEHLLHQDKALELLGCVDTSKELSLKDGIPSWVPDGSVPFLDPCNALTSHGAEFGAENFLATGTSKLTPVVKPLQRAEGRDLVVTMSLLGIHNSVVLSVKPICKNVDHYCALQRLLELVKRRSVHEISAPLLWKAWDHWDDEHGQAGPTTKSLFWTSRGCVGTGSARMRPDDGVHLLIGGRVPYVLRPVESPQYVKTGIQEDALSEALDSSADYIQRSQLSAGAVLPAREKTESRILFQFVGECYVPDIMYGEGLIWAKNKFNPRKYMEHDTGSSMADAVWLKDLSTGPFPFKTSVVSLC